MIAVGFVGVVEDFANEHFAVGLDGEAGVCVRGCELLVPG